MSEPDKEMHIKDIDYPDPVARKSRIRFLPVSPIRLRSLSWLVAFLCIVGGIAIYGTPHLRLIYTYSKFGGAYVYHKCDYFGWNPQTIFPGNGKCPIIKFLKASAGGNR